MPSFNLADQPFIPCIRADGTATELSLRDALAQAPCIREIRDDSPLVTVALHRLLLAIVHRNFGPESLAAWRAIWQAGRFDTARLGAYFAQWHDRFDLCHPTHPFYQTVTMEESDALPVTRLAFVQANNSTLFDHRTEHDARPLAPALVARLLVGYQAFAIGGGVNKPFNLCHSPAMHEGGYLALLTGESLFQTLWLNALRYGADRPMRLTDADCPVWERDEPRHPDPRGTVPDGYLDYLTWPSRRIQLIADGDEPLAFTRMRMLQGLKLADGLGMVEPAAAYAKNAKDEFRARGFQEGRAVWRDAHTLFHDVQGTQRPPLAVSQVANLLAEGDLASASLRLSVLGMCSDQAKIAFWSHEVLPLPQAYLRDDPLLDHLAKGLQAAEDAAKAVYFAVHRLGELLSTGDMGGKPDKERVAQFVKSLDADTKFWSRLENPFRQFLLELPGDSAHQGARCQAWNKTVAQTAQEVFHQVVDSLDASPRILKAVHTDDWGAAKKLNVELAKITQPGTTA